MLVETELKTRKIDAAYFRDKNYFDGNDGTENYLVFQTMCKYFESTTSNGVVFVNSWKSKGISDQILVVTSSLTPTLKYYNGKIELNSRSSLLKQNSITYKHGPIVNIYITYKISSIDNNSSIVLINCLFGAAQINTKSIDTERHMYSGYGICFNSTGSYTHPDGSIGRNAVIIGADMAESKHNTNKTENILILGRGFVQKLNNKTIYPEKIYSPNFSVKSKTFCLSLYYNGDDSYLFFNGKKVIQFKAKDSEIKPRPLCLGNISKKFSNQIIRETGFRGHIYDFSVDYSAITKDKILGIMNI